MHIFKLWSILASLINAELMLSLNLTCCPDVPNWILCTSLYYLIAHCLSLDSKSKFVLLQIYSRLYLTSWSICVMHSWVHLCPFSLRTLVFSMTLNWCVLTRVCSGIASPWWFHLWLDSETLWVGLKWKATMSHSNGFLGGWRLKGVEWMGWAEGL